MARRTTNDSTVPNGLLIDELLIAELILDEWGKAEACVAATQRKTPAIASLKAVAGAIRVSSGRYLISVNAAPLQANVETSGGWILLSPGEVQDQPAVEIAALPRPRG